MTQRLAASVISSTQRNPSVTQHNQVQNWPQYEEGLRNRGSLTVWLGMVDGKLDHWDEPKPRRPNPGVLATNRIRRRIAQYFPRHDLESAALTDGRCILAEAGARSADSARRVCNGYDQAPRKFSQVLLDATEVFVRFVELL